MELDRETPSRLPVADFPTIAPPDEQRERRHRMRLEGLSPNVHGGPRRWRAVADGAYVSTPPRTSPGGNEERRILILGVVSL